MGWAADASSITCLAVPTSRNLAVASPGVNKFSWLEYANVRQKRLPSLGTSVFLGVIPSLGWKLCTSSKIHRLEEAFYSPCHRHRQCFRERFIKAAACGCSPPFGPLDFSKRRP
jgi:hypothetical protein